MGRIDAEPNDQPSTFCLRFWMLPSSYNTSAAHMSLSWGLHSCIVMRTRLAICGCRFHADWRLVTLTTGRSTKSCWRKSWPISRSFLHHHPTNNMTPSKRQSFCGPIFWLSVFQSTSTTTNSFSVLGKMTSRSHDHAIAYIFKIRRNRVCERIPGLGRGGRGSVFVSYDRHS